MSTTADKNLSAAAQAQIESLTQQAREGQISWQSANQQANAVRAGEGGVSYTPAGWNGGVGSGAEGNAAGNGYTENIAADRGLSTDQLVQIQKYRELAKAGVISWDQANTAANSVRSTAGYTVDKTGKTANTQDPYGSFQDFMQNSGYPDYSAQAQQAVQASVDSAVNSYNQQIESTNADSAELARQAYIAKMLGQKNLDQQLSAGGYAGGMADSQRIRTETDYQDNLNNIELQRTSAVRELQTAISNARLSGNQQLAEDLSGYLQNLQSQWSSYVQNQQSISAADRQNADSLTAQQSESNYTKAMNLLAMGILPDSSILTSAGISATKAAAIRNYYLAQQQTAGNASAAKSSYAASSGSAKKTASASGSKSGKTSGGSTDAAESGETEMNISSFTAFGRSVASQLAAGKENAALSNINVNWSKLSDSQKQQIQTLLGRYGYSYSA